MTSKHKKKKGVNENVVATIVHNEYTDILLNQNCLRNSINNIQSKDHRIGPYEINQISFSFFDEKYISKTMDIMALGYQG